MMVYLAFESVGMLNVVADTALNDISAKSANKAFFISLSPLVGFGQISRDEREEKAHLSGLSILRDRTFSSPFFSPLLALHIIENLHDRLHHHEIDEVVIDAAMNTQLLSELFSRSQRLHHVLLASHEL